MQDDVYEKGSCRGRTACNRRMVRDEVEARLRKGAGHDRVRDSRRCARRHRDSRHNLVPPENPGALGCDRKRYQRVVTNPRAKDALALLADKMRSELEHVSFNEPRQGTVEYAVVLTGVLCAVMGLGALAKAMGEGLFVEHALMSASHHLQLVALGSVADIFAF